jgi:RNA ligase (TIGR02306 family)
MRKLATIQEILEINEHPNADAIELAMINGWQVVVKKGEFKVGDKVVFFEIDSWIPTELASFLTRPGQEPRVYQGVKGERLRTVKLRGELSQGLILPLSILEPHRLTGTDQFAIRIWDPEWKCWSYKFVLNEVGADVSEILNILKWEAPIAAHLAGQVRGNFPTFIKKTDQERAQNCYNKMLLLDNYEHGGINWEVTEKLDGSSCTVFWEPEAGAGVCSRNLSLKLEDTGNSFVKIAIESGYIDALNELKVPFAIQGELCGPGIQGNIYKLESPKLFVFDVWLIKERRYAAKSERKIILDDLKSMGVKVDTVPDLGTIRLPSTLKECLEFAIGKSVLNPSQEREGIVFKTNYLVEGEMFSFKCISNKFLLSEKTNE